MPVSYLHAVSEQLWLTLISLMMATEQYCLKWTNYQRNVTSSFKTLLENEEFVDVSIFQPAREARRLAQRAERPRRGLSVLWASRRASAQAVTSKWQLRTTSPMNTNSSVGENWFLAKNGSWPGRL